jgi:hypothetical protein
MAARLAVDGHRRRWGPGRVRLARQWQRCGGDQPLHGDRASIERCSRIDRRREDGRRRGRLAATLGTGSHAIGAERHHDRAVEVGPIDLGARRAESIQRRCRRVSVRIAGAGRRDRDLRSDRIHERLRRRGLAAVMGDLEEVQRRQPVADERRVDRLLDVTREQESLAADGAKEHDRHVVDAGPAVGRLARHLSADRPQDAHVDLVDMQPIARRESVPSRSPGLREPGDPRRISGTRTVHPGLEDAPDAIAIQEACQTRHVVLVRVSQDDAVEPAIPWRDVRVEGDQQPGRVGPSVDQQTPAARPLDEDRVALADVEHRDPCDATWPCDDDGPRHADGHHQRHDRVRVRP